MQSTPHTIGERFDLLRKHSVKMLPEEMSHPELPFCHEKEGTLARLFLGKVKQVQSIGVMPTYDIEVADNHWFYDGAVKSHNSVSLLSGSSPGMHAHQSRWYIRRIRFQQGDPLISLLEECGFHVEPDAYSPNTIVAEFPVEAPGARDDSFRGVGDLTIEEQLATQATLQHWWSDNSVSATITFRPKERRKIAGLLREYSGKMKCTSLLPYTEAGEKTSFKQMPYEPIAEERYQEIVAGIKRWPHEVPKKLHEEKEHEYNIVDLDDCTSGACPVR